MFWLPYISWDMEDTIFSGQENRCYPRWNYGFLLEEELYNKHLENDILRNFYEEWDSWETIKLVKMAKNRQPVSGLHEFHFKSLFKGEFGDHCKT